MENQIGIGKYWEAKWFVFRDVIALPSSWVRKMRNTCTDAETLTTEDCWQQLFQHVVSTYRNMVGAWSSLALAPASACFKFRLLEPLTDRMQLHFCHGRNSKHCLSLRDRPSIPAVSDIDWLRLCMAHRFTPGHPEVTPGTTSYWHTGTTPSLVWQTKYLVRPIANHIFNTC